MSGALKSGSLNSGLSKSGPLKLGLLGHPVAHSLSPAIHNRWLAKAGIDGHYDLFDVPPENFASRVRALIAGGVTGFNVTIPHKQRALDFVDAVDDTAAQIGAVNTIVVEDDGRTTGHNTDAYGVVENLRQSQPDVNLSDKSTLVLGAGGAARATVYALQDAGAKVTLTNRTLEKAQTLADDFGCSVQPWAEKEAVLPEVDLVVNTTSLGMAGQPPLTMSLAELSPAAIVYDIVYKPLMTPLLQAAQARGNPVVTGIGMLACQAQKSFHLWTGVTPKVDAELLKILR